MIRTLPLALVLLVAACSPADDEATDPTAGTGTPAGDAQVITVTLTEHELELSGEASAGEVFFELDNEGDQVHGFVVSGADGDQTLATDIDPGTTQRASIELEAGTYTVWCPIGDHRDLGMEAELEVSESGS